MRDTSRLHSITALLSAWRTDPDVHANIAAWRMRSARPARFVPLPEDLAPVLADSLRARGIGELYTHQATAWKEARAGKNLVIVTGTASGKTLCYNLPVLQRLLEDREARALYLFPTKALAQDQVTQLGAAFRAPSPVPVAAYDGDTPPDSRPAIRVKARIVVSNPDMLHTGILPHHTLWAEFFRHLQFVVIDELHACRGVFGSHIANVLRRLVRVARFYGASPQFILTSATIANPVELAERMVEAPVVLVDDDGAAQGEKHFLIYNPPIVNAELGIRRSAMLEAVRLAKGLLGYDIQTILFARARRTVELILHYLAPNGGVDKADFDLEDREPGEVRGYRSGYLPRQRRSVENGLREGRVRAVVATNALELGIDIGGMGAAVLVGYPGSIAATWQQAGRAGRGSDMSLAVLVTTADPLDQFLAQHPGYFFERSPEHALVNPDNLLILLQHLRCAAFELPFRAGEGFGRVDTARLTEFLQFLEQAGVLHASGDKYFWMADQYPAEGISLRSASADSVALQVDGVVIGKVDLASAYWMVHPQAIYLHEGQSYVVDDLDLAQGLARLSRAPVDYYTEPRRETTVQLLDRLALSEAMGATKAHGEIAVTHQVTGYRKIKWYTHENLGDGVVSLPPTELHTTGYWLGITKPTVESLRAQGLWTNDVNDYGPNWAAQRERARARDQYHCQNCGAPENGRNHDVHHKIPFRALPSFELANRLDNLVTLCSLCHRQAEATIRLRSGLAGLAHVMGHLAPLFLMCDTHDIGVHSDPASALAEGQPAVIIYDEIPAGIGFSERLFELHDEIMERGRELVAACGCEQGCPSCVGPAGENGHSGKRETLALLDLLTNPRRITAGEGAA